MPLTLQKLFNQTLPAEFEILGETVHFEWAPARYTGEMDEIAENLIAQNDAAADEEEALDSEARELREEGQTAAADKKAKAADRIRKARERRDMRHLRTLLAQVLVSWDLMDGDVPLPIDEEHLRRLPDSFVTAVFVSLSAENRADPTKAPSSPASSSTTASSEPSPTGTGFSELPTTSESRPGNSTNGHSPSESIPSGAAGRT